MDLVLGSGSPRRSAILRGIGLTFEVKTADIDERPLPREDPVSYVRRLSQAKAQKVWTDLGSGTALVIGADTIVVLDGNLLGKPTDEAEARCMLTQLAGRSHQVMTSFAICKSDGNCEVHHSITDVHFRAVSHEEIEAYVATGSPMDKAGAYGIQDEAGQFVERIEGSFSNVVGLPVELLVEVLVAHELIPPGPAARLSIIQGRMAAAQNQPNVRPELIAVSKGHEAEKLETFIDLGITRFGESYVQEWMRKSNALESQPEWHFIGRIQSNKLKLIVENSGLIHTVSTLKHLHLIQNYSQRLNRNTSCLLQVNLGDETTKAGVKPSEVETLLKACQSLSHVRVIGLMTLPPRGDYGTMRRYFGVLADIGRRLFGEKVVLSMGMSEDLEAAISQGATMIRVGTALFGARE